MTEPRPGRPVLLQAKAFLRLADAARDFFSKPAAGLERFVGEAKACRAARARLGGIGGLLHEAAVELSWGVEETERFGLSGEPELAQAVSALRAAAAELLSAMERGREEPLLDSKRHASEVERQCRLAGLRARAQPNAVWRLKMEGVCRRFSQAAESLHRAVDLVGGSLTA